MATVNRPSLVDRLRLLWKGPTGSGMFYLGAGRGQYVGQSWDFVRVSNSVYGNPTGYRCIEAIATNFSRPPWAVFPAGTDWPSVGEAKPIEGDHPAVKLLKQPNLFTSGTMMQYLIGRDLELTGKAFWFKDRKGPLLGLKSPPTSLRRLPAQRVTVIGNQDHELLGFVYTDGLGRQVPILSENVLYFRYPHPERVYDGLAPALIAGLPAETDTASTKFNKRLLDNDSALPGYLMLDDLSPDDFAQWKQIWESGSEPGKTRFIGGQQGKYFKVGQTNQELTYGELRQDSQDDVMRAFGVPRAVAFDVSHETYANAEREQSIFMQQNILPKWTMTCDEATLQLVPDYPEPFVIGLNLSGIEELQGSRESFIDREVKMMLVKAKTINEFRRAMGWPDVAWGNEPQAPFQQMSAIPLEPGGENAPPPVPPKSEPKTSIPAPKTGPKTPVPAPKTIPKPPVPAGSVFAEGVPTTQNGHQKEK